MTKRRTMIAVLTLLFVITTVMSGCAFSDVSMKTPSQLIKEAYGDKEFTVSFSNEGLDEPISDIKYTANNIPKLPTPIKVGYVFSGWYFDSSFTTQYQDEILLMLMEDVTLYAKWQKEAMATDGTYDIEFEARILPETVKKGALTDQYGGYKDFTADIVLSETYIQKTQDELLLRIQYDCGVLEPYGALSAVYNITSSQRNPSSVYIDSAINSYSDEIKTVYLRITEADLSEPLYLDIGTTNWQTDGLTDEQRYATTASYTVEFDIVRLIGFSRPYVDSDVTLEDGYYLAETYYKSENNTSNMGSSFNAVYSYIYAENGNYTLIKPISPYYGLVDKLNGGLLTPATANFFYRMMTFMPTLLAYRVDTSAYAGEVQSDYYPATYNAAQYVDYSMEFHADTGRFYSIFDLGSDVKKELAVYNAVTGFMEVAGSYGAGVQILTIDYNHLIKLADSGVDYEPLEGDAYQFEKPIQFYPGEYSDLDERNLTYSAVEAYGLATQMTNYFFSAAGLNTSYTNRTIYSSKISVTPTAETNAKTVADSRYSIAHLNLNTQIYGYEAIEARRSNQILYADSMTVQSFAGNGLREFVETKTGKSLISGSTVRLAELYAEKVDASASFSNVKWTAYSMKNGEIDFDSPVSVSSAFVFTDDLAICFERSDVDGKKTSLVELVAYESPNISIKDNRDMTVTGENTYAINQTYTVGDSVNYPVIEYEWYGKKYSVIANYYESDSGDIGVNPMLTARYYVSDGVYTLAYASRNALSFQMSGTDARVVFQMKNVYGESEFLYFDFTSRQKDGYTVTDDRDRVLAENDLSYDEDGEREAVGAEAYGYLTQDNITEMLSREFYLNFTDGTAYALPLYGYSVSYKTKGGEWFSIEQEVAGKSISDIVSYIYGLIENSVAASIKMTYSAYGDELCVSYVYNVTINGSKSTLLMNYTDYFDHYEYTFSKPAIYTLDGERKGSYRTVKIQKFNGTALLADYLSRSSYSLIDDGLQYRVTFNEIGKFRLSYSVTLNNATLTFYQDIEVYSSSGNVTITYITDADHPFDDGTLERTVTYNLTQNIDTLGDSVFTNPLKTILYGWRGGSDTGSSTVMAGNGISDFISLFHSRHISMTAIWDPGITVTAKATGNSDAVRYYFMQSGSAAYKIDLSVFKVYPPVGYVLVGWTGGFLGEDVATGTITLDNVDYTDPNYFMITAVFKKQYTVKYSVPSAYSSTVFRNEVVTDGDSVSKKRTPVANDGYRFVGWCVEGDETQTTVDLSVYKVTGDTTFVAKFAPIDTGVLHDKN